MDDFIPFHSDHDEEEVGDDRSSSPPFRDSGIPIAKRIEDSPWRNRPNEPTPSNSKEISSSTPLDKRKRKRKDYNSNFMDHLDDFIMDMPEPPWVKGHTYSKNLVRRYLPT
jgi:hypothetical protein